MLPFFWSLSVSQQLTLPPKLTLYRTKSLSTTIRATVPEISATSKAILSFSYIYSYFTNNYSSSVVRTVGQVEFVVTGNRSMDMRLECLLVDHPAIEVVFAAWDTTSTYNSPFLMEVEIPFATAKLGTVKYGVFPTGMLCNLLPACSASASPAIACSQAKSSSLSTASRTRDSAGFKSRTSLWIWAN
jgi:hypothetical protein